MIRLFAPMIATAPRALLFGAISIALALATLHAVSAADTDEVDSRGEPSLEGAYNDWSL